MRTPVQMMPLVQRRHQDPDFGKDNIERLLRDLERQIAGVDTFMVTCSMAKSELDLIPTTHLRDTVDNLRQALERPDKNSRKRSNCLSTWPKE